MELTGPTLLARTRKLLNDLVAPYFLSDEELYSYLSDAQRVFAEKTGGLILSKTYSTSIGGSYISAPQLSIDFASEVINAWHVGAEGRMRRLQINGRIPDHLLPPDDGWSDIEDDTVETGPPVAVLVGLHDARITVIPVPDAVFSIQVDYRGLPDEEINSSTGPQLPARYHTYLPFGAATLAYAGTAEEHFDPKRMQSIEGQWLMALNDAYVAHRVRYAENGVVQFDGNGMWG